MLKRTMTYTDYNNVVRTEDFYFNLTKAEVMETQLTYAGGFSETIEAIVKANDTPALVKIFKEFVLSTVGIKSPDGRRFEKSQDIRDAFEQCPAYSDLFMELATDDKKAAAFIKGVVPADMADKVDTAKLSLV